jgi:acetylornithine deacetylase/succinyl-diaminopimelate desuccinylase-like protein
MSIERQTVDRQAVLERIDADELVELALALANFDSPTGEEGPVGEYVYDWLKREGFEARKAALVPNRPNVIGVLPGSGNGRSLCFNSHLDTSIHKDDWWRSRYAAAPINHSAWREGDTLFGNGICNDKGPMATWLMAAKAIKQSGVRLKGDLVLMAVVGEIGMEPVDEFQPPAYLGKDAGTRYAITHGGVADYALVAEGTDFGLVGVEAGKAFFKVTVFGKDQPTYTPYVTRPMPFEKHPNAILGIIPFMQKFEEWAHAYEQKQRYECPGGTVVPRAQIGAIRGGIPWKITNTAQQCAVYVDVRLTPVQNPLDVRAELAGLLSEAGLNGEVELFLYRPGYEADMQKAKPLTGAISRAHRALLGGEPGLARPNFTSMWRDVNCFNEMRIPAISYGPGVSLAAGTGNFSMKIDAMLTGAKLYALTALDLCDQPRDR